VKHPYEGIPDYARWDRAVAQPAAGDVDPVVRFPFRLTREHRVVTAGSCFAQHISRYLRDAGFNHLVTERGHPLLSDFQITEVFNYGVFSARFGNVYTARQLEQLFRRAFGTFVPAETVWTRADGRLVDPFRPTIQQSGFRTQAELEADRRQHLAAVRRAFEELDVFIFTLGLTECWTIAADGAALPLAPGVAGGVYDPARYTLVNLGVDDVVTDMTRFIDGLRAINPTATVILTVSPVPLSATALDRHVLVSTTYSKAVLRVAAEQLASSLEAVHYFPAYEIVTGQFARGEYFGDDLRSVTASGVNHVMSLFFTHAAERGTGPAAADQAAPVLLTRAQLKKALKVMCDEELLLLGTDSRRP
jgi:hypothetical protein